MSDNVKSVLIESSSSSCFRGVFEMAFVPLLRSILPFPDGNTVVPILFWPTPSLPIFFLHDQSSS